MGTGIRILFVSHVSRLGGAERSLVELLRGLDRARFEPVAVVPGPGELADALARAGVPCHTLPLRRLRKTLNPLRLAGAFLNVAGVAGRLAGLIRRDGIALVHANSDTAQLYGGPAARLAGVPCVWHARDLAELGPLGPWLARRASAVIAISECVRRHVERYVRDPATVRLIRHGVVPPPPAAPAAGAALRAELGLPEGAPLVGMIAQMVPWKNQRAFIEMAARLRATASAARFVIAGDDLFGDHRGYRAGLQARVAELGLAGVLVFAGHRPDIGPLLAGLDVLVHPCAREPLGRVVLEAMAAGRPVVAVNACGPGEIVRPGVDGMLTATADPAELAATVAKVLGDPALAARLGAAARQRAGAFDPRDTARQVEAVYDALLAGRARPCA